MGMLVFDDVNEAEMRKVQNAVVQTLLPFRERTEPAIVVFALIRCARVLLRLYSRKTQGEILPAIVAYLEGKTTAPGASSLFLSDN